jgi:hypothetical protein
MEQQLIDTIKQGLGDGSIIPYIGAQALAGSVNLQSGEPIPADSDSLILAMNGGRPMAPKLMYEFPRAAMNLELKRGRSFVTRFLNTLYGETEWSRAPLHDWLKAIKPACVVDINRDLQLQQSYSDTPHNLMLGIARIGGTDFRYKLYHYDGTKYQEISNEQADPSLPLLLKPMGSPQPEANYIASDADYVDYITELMGGFGVPKFFKAYRKEKRYLLLGLRLNRDTERMVLADLTYDRAGEGGWAVIPNATDKEKRFCRNKLGIEVLDMPLAEFMGALGVEIPETVEA